MPHPIEKIVPNSICVRNGVFTRNLDALHFAISDTNMLYGTNQSLRRAVAGLVFISCTAL